MFTIHCTTTNTEQASITVLLFTISSYQDMHGGEIGLVVDCEWSEALSDKVEDKNAAARRLDFQLGW